MRKRIDIEPNQEELIELLRKNPIGRNAELVEFTNELSMTEAPYTYFVDGDWGSGKSIFVKQLIILIEYIADVNSGICSKLVNALKDVASLANIKTKVEDDATSPIKKSYFPVYYNAWENDHWNNPLPSLIQSIAWGVGLDGQTRNKADENEVLVGILNDLMKWAHLESTASVLTGKDLLLEFEEHNEIRKKIRSLLREAASNNETQLVLVIDELDRCRPTFALELLEQVKTLFNQDNLITVFAVNSAQLARTIEGCYGPGFDGNRYLAKFCDHTYTLQDPSQCDYLSYVGLDEGLGRTRFVATEFADRYSMSLRDRNRLADAIIASNRYSLGGVYQGALVGEQVVATVLMCLEIYDMNSFRRIASERNENEFFEIVSDLRFFWRNLDELGRYYLDFGAMSEIDDKERNAIRKRILADYLTLIFSVDYDSSEFRAAQSRLLEDDYGILNLSHIRKMLYC